MISANKIIVSDGHEWFVMFDKPCLVCHKEHQVINNAIPDHPICDDNLKLLEWECAKRESKK